MAHDQADDARRGSPDGGTAPLAADTFAERTAALSPGVTATTPQPEIRDHQPAPHQPAPHQPAPHQPAPHQPAPGGGPPTATWSRPPGAPSTRRRALIVALCALAGTGIGVGAQRLTAGHGTGDRAVPAPSASAAPISAQVTSFDPKADGSGFRQQNGSWKSQTYSSAQFGNLKPGIGLQLDLGSAHALQSITLDAQTGPLMVELRAGDAAVTNVDTFARVGAPVSAKGPTTLPATGGGSHRYWLIWVTSLAPSGDGYSALIGKNITAKG
ncbi:MAG TPA: hypothetical protein VI248_10525 [Kineosporiaceae bacterium]